MSNEDEFFAEMHPQIAQVIGIAVMQLLVEKREPSREALIEMIQVLWQGDQADLAVELALGVVVVPEEEGKKKKERKKKKEKGRSNIRSVVYEISI